MRKNIILLASILTSSLVMANNSHDHHHQPSTEFGKDYLSSMVEMHQGMEQAAFAQNPDVSFAQGMIVHHQGAIEMAKIQLKYGKDPEMRQLAEQIIQAQEPEIKQMEDWLNKHNEKIFK
ncbi:DUF305 family protein family protein [Volucribacter psittacicida]|uniref:DUF305 family protein family protein n=1 Tax=Volucribacter psittacicida TaxID=203482 RepID=A0A4R1FU86_9PAST|nr:DUF305 domain-containing protein [Volucribacter psittacicida]TCJ98457.1 DUF305 family protein family protein [Volucribacter psittacicida]